MELARDDPALLRGNMTTIEEYHKLVTARVHVSEVGEQHMVTGRAEADELVLRFLEGLTQQNAAGRGIGAGGFIRHHEDLGNG